MILDVFLGILPMFQAIPLAAILTRANEYVDQSQYSAANALYSLIQEHFPEQADCLHGMGVLALNTNYYQAGLQLLKRAVKALYLLPSEEELLPTKALFLANLGRAYKETDQLAWAMMCWSLSMEAEAHPTVQAWFEAGLAQAKSQSDLALAALPSIITTEAGNKISGQLKKLLVKRSSKLNNFSEHALENMPDQLLISKTEGLIELNTRLAAQQAEPYAIELIRRYPMHGDAWHWRGIACHYQKRSMEAVGYLQKATEIFPEHPYYWNTLGVVQRQVGFLREALYAFERALQIKPDYAEAGMNLANLLRDEGEYNDAIGWYVWAQRIKPDYVESWNNLGILFKQQKKFDKAKTCFERAIRMRENYPNPYLNLGVIAEEQKDRETAIAYYQKTLDIKPDCHDVRLSLVHQKMYLCDWVGLEQDIATVRQLVTEGYPGELMPFNFLALPGSSALEQKRCGELFVNARYGRFICQAKEIGFTFPRERRNKVKIGYLSADYRQHAVAISIVQVLEKHDREKFEIFAYGYTSDDGSDVRKRIGAATNFVNLENYSALDAARKIHEDGIDILIDLTAYTANSRSEIMALRPAPIQVNYLGYPSTMAAPFIDYLIGDPIITPFEHAHHFTEKLALLPHCYFPNDRERKITQGITREQEGLPEGSFVFCSFNQPYKINPALWDIWCDLLQEIPGSVLWLHAFEDTARVNLRRSLEQKGIDPNRLYFASIRKNLEDHLGRLVVADLALDTIPYNGHTTTSDALWAGLPVLTCPGETFASRVAASILTAANVPELVASSLEEYKQFAMSLALDPEKVKTLKAKMALNRNTCPLYDSIRMTKNLERIYFEMYENWISGNEPKQIKIFDGE